MMAMLRRQGEIRRRAAVWQCLWAAFAAAACEGPLLAHGGMYRGPPPFPAVPNPGGGPYTPGLIGTPAGPKSTGPVTGGRPDITDDSSWEVWWEFNKDSFLLLRAAVHQGVVSGSDEFFLGTKRGMLAREALAPTAADRHDLAPILAKLLQQERQRDMSTACLVALAKLGVESGPDLDPQLLYASQLRTRDQEVRETAALTFGIDGAAAGLAPMLALVRDDAEGRVLSGSERVPERTRAFAAYGLGLLAHRRRDVEVSQQVHDALAPLLMRADLGHNLRVAAVSGLGLLGLDPARPKDKRLLWATLGELWRFYDADFGRGGELVQAHAPAAVARLLGRGNGPDHAAAKTKLMAELEQGRRSPNVLRAAALALGDLALPEAVAPEDAAVVRQLLRCWQGSGDQMARRFAVIALGRIGGASCQQALLKVYGGALKATERPWLALALGVCAFRARQDGAVDEALVRPLLYDFTTQQNKDLQAALAVALGLAGCRDAADPMAELLTRSEGDEHLAGYLCVGLALLEHRAAVSQLSAIAQRSLRRPFLLMQACVALGRLGDKTAVPLLLARMREGDNAAGLAALAQAVGAIGDRHSIEPLQRLAADRTQPALVRAFVAAAMGAIGDKDELPWNACLAADVNYAAAVETLTDGCLGVLDIL
jgi:HEAT repeat protein